MFNKVRFSFETVRLQDCRIQAYKRFQGPAQGSNESKESCPLRACNLLTLGACGLQWFLLTANLRNASHWRLQSAQSVYCNWKWKAACTSNRRSWASSKSRRNCNKLSEWVSKWHTRIWESWSSSLSFLSFGSAVNSVSLAGVEEGAGAVTAACHFATDVLTAYPLSWLKHRHIYFLILLWYHLLGSTCKAASTSGAAGSLLGAVKLGPSSFWKHILHQQEYPCFWQSPIMIHDQTFTQVDLCMTKALKTKRPTDKQWVQPCPSPEKSQLMVQQ